MEPQAGGPIGSGVSLHSGRCLVFAVVGQKNACREPSAGPYDDGLEQPAHGLFGAVLNRTGLEAAGGTALPASVDAAERGALAGTGREIAGGCGSATLSAQTKKGLK